MRTRRVWIEIVAIACAVTCACIVLGLAARLKSESARHRAIVQRVTRPADGMWVPNLTLPTIRSDSVRIGGWAIHRPQVLFFFTTTCPYCRSSIPAAAVLDSVARTMGVEMVGVSLDEPALTSTYVSEHGISFKVGLMNAPGDKLAYRAFDVPLFLILSDSGRAIRARVGVVENGIVLDSLLVSLRRVAQNHLTWAGEVPSARGVTLRQDTLSQKEAR